MKAIAIFLFSLLLLSACKSQEGDKGIIKESPKEGENMQIKSNAFQSGKEIPSKYTCDGKNISPGLIIIDAPKPTKSFALIVDDPDAPRGIFTHWILWNIPANTTEIKENTSPGMQGKNDFNKLGYGGPCPPSGTHRYVFKVYALDTMLSLQQGSNKQQLESAIKQHVLESAELIGRYSRI